MSDEIHMKLDQTKSPSLPRKEDEEKEDEDQGNETEEKEPRIVADKAASIAELDFEIGSVLPDFTLTCVDGEKHKLSDFRGTKVMLCFYSFAHCPYCAYTISKIVGAYKKLAWASKLKVVFVFRTDLAFLKQGLTSDDCPIPRLSPDKDCYPFLALADEDGEVGKTYQTKSKSLLAHASRFWKDLPILRKVMGGLRNTVPITLIREKLKFPMTPFMLPSELLIDEEGILVDIYRSENSLETMAIDRVTQFLLFGTKIPSSKDVRNTLDQKRDPRRKRKCD